LVTEKTGTEAHEILDALVNEKNGASVFMALGRVGGLRRTRHPSGCPG